MELDPKYVDVIVTRWQDYTGKIARLDVDERSFDEIRAERLKSLLNQPVPPGDCGNRSQHSWGTSGHRGTLSGAVRLVRRTRFSTRRRGLIAYCRLARVGLLAAPDWIGKSGLSSRALAKCLLAEAITSGWLAATSVVSAESLFKL